MKSGFGADRLQKFFSQLRDRTVREHLEARQLPESLARPFAIAQKNVAPPEKVGGALLGGMVPYFILLFCLTGAMYPAMDLTAGEKERGTIETILCSPVSRTDLGLGKFLMVLTASVGTAVLAIVAMAVSFGVGKKMLAVAMPRGGRLSPANHHHRQSDALHIFCGASCWRCFFPQPCWRFPLFAKSFKEAQSYISPLMILVVMPAMAALLPGVELNSALALIPVLNTSLVSKEIISGTTTGISSR